MFSNLLAKIMGHAPAQATPSSQPAAAAPAASTLSATPAVATTAAAPAAVPVTPSVAPAAAAPVDMTAILDGLASKNSEKLDWRKSIVDLLKLVGMDSSLTARKELAHDLNYSGDTADSAAMNVWLQKEVMKKLSENGGQVPSELLS